MGEYTVEEYWLKGAVRHGGFTSTALFNLYMNQLIKIQSDTRIGCHIDGVYCMYN